MMRFALVFASLYLIIPANSIFGQFALSQNSANNIKQYANMTQDILTVLEQKSIDTVKFVAACNVFAQRMNDALELAAVNDTITQCIGMEYPLSAKILLRETNTYNKSNAMNHMGYAFGFIVSALKKTHESLNNVLNCVEKATAQSKHEDDLPSMPVAGLSRTLKLESVPIAPKAPPSSDELLHSEHEKIEASMLEISSSAHIHADSLALAAIEARDKTMWTELTLNAMADIASGRIGTTSASSISSGATSAAAQEAQAYMYMALLAVLPATFYVEPSLLNGEFSFGFNTIFSAEDFEPFSSSAITGVSIRYRQLLWLQKNLSETRYGFDIDVPIYLTWIRYSYYDYYSYTYYDFVSRLYIADPMLRFWYGRFGAFYNLNYIHLERNDEGKFCSRFGGSFLIGSLDYTCKAYALLNVGYANPDGVSWRSGWSMDLDVAVNNLLLNFSYDLDSKYLQAAWRIRIPW